MHSGGDVGLDAGLARINARERIASAARPQTLPDLTERFDMRAVEGAFEPAASGIRRGFRRQCARSPCFPDSVSPRPLPLFKPDVGSDGDGSLRPEITSTHRSVGPTRTVTALRRRLGRAARAHPHRAHDRARAATDHRRRPATTTRMRVLSARRVRELGSCTTHSTRSRARSPIRSGASTSPISRLCGRGSPRIGTRRCARRRRGAGEGRHRR